MAGAWALERHARLPSTNDRAKELARAGAPSRTVVVATEQTGGRGRGGHDWTSPPGGLYASVLLRDVPQDLGPLLPLVVGLALVEAAQTRFPDLRFWLKWPNDLLAAAKDAPAPVGKAGGVLVEAAVSGRGLDWIVAGVGVNVATGRARLPASPERRAVSLGALSGHRDTPDGLLRTLLDRLDAALQRYRTEPAKVAADAAQWLAYRGQTVQVVPHAGEHPLVGRLVGLAPDGALRILVEGVERSVDPWDAAALRPVG